MDTIVHQTAAVARLAQFIKGKPNFELLLQGLTNRAQELETALQALLSERNVDTSIGAQLDVLGKIVGQVRGGLGDEDYRTFIRARIRINKSSGTVPEILDVFATLLAVLNPGATLRFRDEPPAAFTLEFHAFTTLFTLSGAEVFEQLLHSMRAAGVRGLMEFGIADPSEEFTFDTGLPAQSFDDGHFRTTLGP